MTLHIKVLHIKALHIKALHIKRTATRWAAPGLVALAFTTGCGTPTQVSPLPGDSAPLTTAPSASATATSTVTSTTTSPTSSPASSSPRPSSGCLGAITYTVDGSDSADVPRGLCMRVGGRLRIENTFPNASAVPPSRATCEYEAGIVNCRLNATGSVTITWGEGAEQRSTTITVIA